MKESDLETEKEQETAEPVVPVEVATITPEQLDELKQRAAKADENWDRLLRTTADFDNYKKRAAREKQDAIKFANENLISKLITVLDALDMALAATQNAQGDSQQSLVAGINMVYQQLKSTLAEAGLEEINAASKPFDPNLHEAVSQKETTDVPEDHVAEQLRKGYKLRDRLLRPASVVVAKPPKAGS
ncbi:MAG TPA: nucleotide exchange factor GrpE [Candidatus Limnocylindrales bacterium]|jgi:molecular chaperone GrpE|nr:nucleotide exchange factor GrpE [Candidatus Limnocylindrales bacterium]